jgi:hypothetical protein
MLRLPPLAGPAPAPGQAGAVPAPGNRRDRRWIARAKPQPVGTCCLDVVDGQYVLLVWKSTEQQKPYSIPVQVVEKTASMARVVAKPSPAAPDGIDLWVARCSIHTAPAPHAGEFCLDIVDGQYVLLLPVQVIEKTANMARVVAKPSLAAPAGIDLWAVRCPTHPKLVPAPHAGPGPVPSPPPHAGPVPAPTNPVASVYRLRR